VVTDVTGAPLDFSHGAKLHANSGVVATDGRFHEQVVDAVRSVLG
jgi:3'(2'), 5'-bisphosphate nucleotidase